MKDPFLMIISIIQTSTYKINDREISVNLKKKKSNDNNNNLWPRLTKASAKLPWLKVKCFVFHSMSFISSCITQADFDKMTFSEDESDHEQKKSMFVSNSKTNDRWI